MMWSVKKRVLLAVVCLVAFGDGFLWAEPEAVQQPSAIQPSPTHQLDDSPPESPKEPRASAAPHQCYQQPGSRRQSPRKKKPSAT